MRPAWLMLFLIASCSDSSAQTTEPGTDGGGPDGGAAAGDGASTQDQDVGPTYCSTLDPEPFLCVDFDDGRAPADLFTSTSGGAVEERSLRIESDGATDAWVEHEADPSPHWSVVELGFSLRIDDQATDARTIIARIGQHMTDTECRVELELQPSGLTLKGGTADAKLTKTLTNGEAARIVLLQEAAPDAGKLRANVTIDGQPALAAPVELSCAAFPGPPRITLGRINGAGAIDLRFDDVVFDGR